MARSEHVSVSVDRDRIRGNIDSIRAKVKVPVWAVIKADAYGLGAEMIADTVASAVDGFCTFSLDEAVSAGAWDRHRKPAMALGPPSGDVDSHCARRVCPAVSTIEEARALRAAGPQLCLDTGMQRFACPPELLDSVLEAGACQGAFTHASRVEQAIELNDRLGGRGLTLHAAGSALLETPEARLDLVRPGLAMYSGAVRVSTPLVEVRRTQGPAGYTRFAASWHGVIMAGYAHGVRPGLCLINGVAARLVETGMQTTFVTFFEPPKVGDEVVLLGETLSAQTVAAAWGCTGHEALMRLAGSGRIIAC